MFYNKGWQPMARGPYLVYHAKSFSPISMNYLLREYSPPFFNEFQTVVLPLFEKAVVLLCHKISAKALDYCEIV